MSNKPFQPMSKEDNKECTVNGISLYEMLKEMYPNQNVKDLDMILNSLCIALIVHMKENVDQDNHKYFLQLIHKTINDNIKVQNE